MHKFLDQLSTILIFGGIIQSIFVVLVLNNKSIRKSRANLFLSILLIALSFSIAHIVFAGAVINHLSVEVYSLGDPTFFLIAPLLWFYVDELTGHRVRWSWQMIFHFAPFLLIILFSLTFRSISPVRDFVSFLDQHRKSINVFFWTSVVVQFSGYLLLIRKKWNTYRAYVQQEVSNTENVDISWVRFFMVVFLLINIFFLFSLFAAIHLENGSWFPKTTALIFSLSVFALGYKGILQKDIFIQPEKEKLDEAPLPLRSQMPDDKPDIERVNKLLVYMDEKRPYLDPELTLSQLAKDLSMSRSHLSQLINDGIGDNFYDFINKYRVEQVKKLMVDPQAEKYNMLGLALEAGFKSKSTFNLIFKRFTGLTPTEYRKNIRQQDVQ